MLNLKKRASRAALPFTLITGAALITAPAFAGDCNMKTTKTPHHSTSMQSAQVTNVGWKAKNKGTIVDAAVSADALSTLVAAVTAAGLVDTLAGPGPFTVFAPTNDAFGGLPAGTVDTLLKPENKAALTNVLTSHVVSGNFTASYIVGLAKANGGSADIETLSGATLTAILAGDTLYVKDEQGGLASVDLPDILQSNGTVHVVNRVLLPGESS